MPETRKDGESGELSPLEKLQQEMERLTGDNLKLQKENKNIQSAFNKRDNEIRELRESVEGFRGEGGRGGESRRSESRRVSQSYISEDDPYVQHLQSELEKRDRKADALAQRFAEQAFVQGVKPRKVKVKDDSGKDKEVVQDGRFWIARMETLAAENPALARRHRFVDAEGNVDYEKSLLSMYNELRIAEIDRSEEEAEKQREEEAINRRRRGASAVISGDDTIPETPEGLDFSKLPESADDMIDILEEAGLVDADSRPSDIGDSLKKK